jgi:hypothetical protein
MPRAASPPYGKYAWDGAVIFEVSGLVFNRRQWLVSDSTKGTMTVTGLTLATGVDRTDKALVRIANQLDWYNDNAPGRSDWKQTVTGQQ